MISTKTKRHGNTEKGHQLRPKGVREDFLEEMTCELVLKVRRGPAEGVRWGGCPTVSPDLRVHLGCL